MRIVQVNTVETGANGITNVMLGYCTAILKLAKDIRFDLVCINEPEEKYTRPFLKSGGKVYVLSRLKHPLEYRKQLGKIFRGADAVHAHGNSATLALEMEAAFNAGVPLRIAHSHNTASRFKILDAVLRPSFYRYCNLRAACGADAGRWLFKDRRFEVFNNGIDTEKFAFNPKLRKEARAALGIGNGLCVLHIGLFNEAKNQSFLIEAFAELLKRRPDSKLILIGDGSLKEKVHAKAEALLPKGSCIFINNTDRIPYYLSAADVFAMPSLHEGLPLVLLEAQDSGIICICSENITKEADKTGLLRFLPLGSPENWADEMASVKAGDREKQSLLARERMKKEGLDIDDAAKKLLDFYREERQEFRVAVVAHNLTAGGAERVVARLLNSWAESGVNCSLVLTEKTKHFYTVPGNVNIYEVEENSKNPLINKWRRFKKVRDILTDIYPDVVLSMPEEIGIYVLAAMKGTKIPVVVSERNNPWKMPDKPITRLMRILTYPSAAALIFQTKKARSFFPRKQRKKGWILPNPLDISALPEPIEPGAEREKIIYSVGRLEKQKNFFCLVDAFEIFHRRYPLYRLVIFGEGTQREALQEYITGKGLKKSVFMPGTVKDPMKIVKNGTAFVLSSDYEGMPNALIEALACGVPCIATDCPSGGPNELIDDGVNGFLVPVGDYRKIAEDLERIISEREKTENICREAIKLRSKFDSQVVCPQWLDFLKEVSVL